jgi:hypothetical protein
MLSKKSAYPSITGDRYHCEFCGVSLPNKLLAMDDTVCSVCDLNLELDWKKEQAQLKARAAKRQCRICTDPLTPDRYFECHKCNPPEYAREFLPGPKKG